MYDAVIYKRYGTIGGMENKWEHNRSENDRGTNFPLAAFTTDIHPFIHPSYHPSVGRCVDICSCSHSRILLMIIGGGGLSLNFDGLYVAISKPTLSL
jgi:hypothetical protein